MPTETPYTAKAFGYLLNTFEHASQSDAPATLGYAKARRELLNFVASLLTENEQLRAEVGARPASTGYPLNALSDPEYEAVMELRNSRNAHVSSAVTKLLSAACATDTLRAEVERLTKLVACATEVGR